MNRISRLGLLASCTLIIASCEDELDSTVRQTGGSGGQDAGLDVSAEASAGADSAVTADALDAEEEKPIEPDSSDDAASEDVTEAGLQSACLPLVGAPPIEVEDFLRIDGSTSTYPLDMVIACELFGIPWKWERNDHDTSSVVPAPRNLEELDLATRLMSTIVHSTTDPAFVNLIQGKKDLILVASKPSDDDLALAASLGVTLEPKPVALDALIFLVNAQNRVEGLSSSEILQIYEGKILDWSAVGGAPGPINPYVRPENSGSQELMEELVLKGATTPPWSETLMVYSMGGLVDMIKADSQAIGYTVYYYWTYQYLSVGTKKLAVDGVLPAHESIRSREYAYVADVYSVIRTDLPADNVARKLRDWLLTPSGQCVVGQSGYVGLTQ